MVIHNVTGAFTLAGQASLPFKYHVRNIRDGNRFCVRTVEVVQEEDKGICFTSTCSFKLEEQNLIDHQDNLDIREKYKVALGEKTPEEVPEAPGVDSPWYWKHLEDHGYEANDKLPGLRIRKVDMRSYNDSRNPLEKRQLYFYTPIGNLPPVTEQPNIHACAHLYASDRNSLFIITNFTGVGDDYAQMGSLMHSVVFHVGMEGLDFYTKDGKPRWYTQESWMTRARQGRGMHNSRLWNGEGLHVATTWQDGLVRIGGVMSKKLDERREKARARATERL